MMNTYQLARWLMREIHGISIGRRAPRGRRRGPARDWRYRRWIRTQPCAVCGSTKRIEAAHTGADGRIPLCADCHRLAPHSYHRLGRPEFERRHHINCAGLVLQLNFEYRDERIAA